jgi:glycosyltransferase involved in cell wall biosynthesis
MRILVFAHRLEVGGTQRNAIDLSIGLRDFFGHEVFVFASPGPMVEVIQDAGLRYIPAPDPTSIPSVKMSRALHLAIRDVRPDVLHAWDWQQCVDAYLTGHVIHGVPIVVTDMVSEQLTRVLPRLPVTTFGTPEFAHRARALGRNRAVPLLPPVDVVGNAPDVVDPTSFRHAHGLKETDLVVVTVSRLVQRLKGESLRRTIDAVRRLGRELPVKLVLVGGGSAYPELAAAARLVNAALDREAVIMAGEMLDPRPAYAAADIVVGMGGSALRAMAFGKPVIVVGAAGFAKPLTSATFHEFLYRGIYGNAGPHDADELADHIRWLAFSSARREAIGAFSREFVLRHFALQQVCADLDRYLRTAISLPVSRWSACLDLGRTISLLGFGPAIPRFVRRIVHHREMAAMRNVNKPMSEGARRTTQYSSTEP